MSTRTGSFFTSKLFFWLLFAVVGCYFLFSVRVPVGKSKYEPLLQGDIKGFLKTLYMPRVKLGIDLQGGTYLVLSVGVEKAIENRLMKESKHLQELFKKEKLAVVPASVQPQVTKVVYTFETEEAAKACFHFIHKHAPLLAAVEKGATVILTLNPVDEQGIRSGAVDQAVSVLQNRLNGFGVAGLIVQRHGERQIVVQLPGVDDPERVKALITKTALLEFKLVEKVAANVDDLLDEYAGDLPSDRMIVHGQKDAEGVYLVSAYPDVTGDHISEASVGYDEFMRVQVDFGLDSTGGQLFQRLTSENIGRQLGIVIDNVMYSAPTIQSAIGSRGAIHGSYTIEQARDLALVLRSGSLLAPLKFEQESRVGASLGQDSIEKGLLACLLGLLLVLLFSIFYYRTMGFFAVLALVYNLFLILLFLSYFESTLTLPGIAGMVLTIGMAVDASILIFEKIREDLLTGISFRQAVQSGFSGAMVVILDSNVTTFLTGLILFKFGGPAVKGFAITLMAGILATLAAGVFFLRAVLSFALDVREGEGFKF